jgi:tetratricopeptide (TPR) repeat protein
MPDLTDFEKTCFIIMPFGKKKVGDKDVDFDVIYNTIFEPAISAAVLPEGKTLEPKRTDVDKFSSSISQDMFEYIMYSRVAFTDISGFNPNVFYELGIRHATQESGTIIFRQPNIPIPFDITSIKVFDYKPDTGETADSKALITNVLTETLKRNRLDSPVRLALRAQGQILSGQDKEKPASARDTETKEKEKAVQTQDQQLALLNLILREAEEALRTHDLMAARTLYKIVLRIDPDNVISRMRLGLILKEQKQHFDALEQFSYVTQRSPDYGEAWREKGVVESLIYRLVPKDKNLPDWLPNGEESLRRATALNPQDYDAWAAWGGVLRRKPDYAAACEKYQRSAEVSNGHPYPLLNALKLEAMATGTLDLDSKKDQLRAAEELRMGQSRNEPPKDTPWCYFDLAEMKLYQHDPGMFLHYLERALDNSERWQVETFYKGLKEALVDTKIKVDLPGLDEGMKKLEEKLSLEERM